MESSPTEINHVNQKFSNGDIYHGEIKNLKKEGKGTYTFNNGDTYEGDFINGLMEGEGIYTYCKTASKYDGFFKGEKRHGKEIFIMEMEIYLMENLKMGK